MAGLETLRAAPRRLVDAGPSVWLGILAVGAAGVLVWHEWANSKHPETSWLDPEQPALQLDLSPEQVPQVRPRKRTYPDTLMAWGCSPVGDC